MMGNKVAVVTFPGSNCDHDTVWALEQLDAEVVVVRHDARDLPACERVVLPGGFSYGDYLRAGALAAHAPIMDAVGRAVERETVSVLGICNGFQILCERGILPGALWSNTSGEFVCRWEWVEVASPPAGWPEFSTGMRFRLPVAHGQGAFRVQEDGLAQIWAQGGPFLRYVDPTTSRSTGYSPNGSVDGIAGISRGRVIGLMPHPERAMHSVFGSVDGRRFLRMWLGGP